MAGATFSAHDAVLHENYGDVHDTLQYFTEVINRLPTSRKKPEGRQYRESVVLSYPQGYGYRGPDQAATSDAQTSSYTEAIIQQCYGEGSIEIDWVLMEHNSGMHSYVNVMNEQMRQFTKAQTELGEKIAVSDGTGRLGFDSSQQLDAAHMRGRVDRQSNDSSGRLVVRMYGSHNDVWFRTGMMVEFMYDPTGSAAAPAAFNTWEKRDNPARGYWTILTVVKNKSSVASQDYITLTMAEPPVGAGNDPGQDETTKYDVIVMDEAVDLNSSIGGLNLTNIPYGLDALIADVDAPMQVHTPTNSMRLADASMHGIPSTTTQWQSEVSDGSGGYFSLDVAQDTADGVARRSAGGPEQFRFLLMDHFQARKYTLSLPAQERYPHTGKAGKFASGTSTMFNSHRSADVSDKEVIKSRFQLRDRVHLVGKGIRQYTLKPFGWVSVGGIWHRDFNGAHKNRATATGYTNIGITERVSSGKIINLRTT